MDISPIYMKGGGWF